MLYRIVRPIVSRLVVVFVLAPAGWRPREVGLLRGVYEQIVGAYGDDHPIALVCGPRLVARASIR